MQEVLCTGICAVTGAQTTPMHLLCVLLVIDAGDTSPLISHLMGLGPIHGCVQQAFGIQWFL
jgi:hypothetical protein